MVLTKPSPSIIIPCFCHIATDRLAKCHIKKVTILTLAPWATLQQIGLVLTGAVAPPIEPRVVQPLSLQGIITEGEGSVRFTSLYFPVKGPICKTFFVRN